MSTFATFTVPEPVADEDRFSPQDNIGHVIVVKPTDHKTGIITSNSPGGTDAIVAEVLDLDATGGPRVFRDALIFGGAMVDGLKPFLGQMTVVKLEQKLSASGRKYPTPVPFDHARAEAYWAANGDPFGPVFATAPAAVVPAGDEPPF